MSFALPTRAGTATFPANFVPTFARLRGKIAVADRLSVRPTVTVLSGKCTMRSFRPQFRRHCLLIAAVLCLPAPALTAQPTGGLRALYEQYTTGYSERLDGLAVECDQEGDVELARQVRSWLPRRTPDRIYVFEPSGDAAAAANSSALQRRFLQMRQQHGLELLELSRKIASDGDVSGAIMLLTESVRESPDLGKARQLLGYEQVKDRWLTPEAAGRQRAGQKWTDEFGWLPADHVERYRSGERNYRGRWISAEQDARIRSDISRGWQIETDHYQITTNHSLRTGVELAQRLERLYDSWWQVFAAYHMSDRDLKAMFAQGHPPHRQARRHKVVYFRDRAEYNASLKRIQAGIEGTLGIYFADVKTAYLFAGDEQDAGTIFHEATHQLFSEVIPTHKVIALRDNFWIVEGIACFMESLHLADGYATLGGASQGRLPAARYRLQEDGFYVPFGQFVAYGTQQLQRDPRIRTLYSQAAGQATFLMQYDHGRYRRALAEYLQAIYRGTARPETLASTTGVQFRQMDEQYREFLITKIESPE